MTGTYAQCHHQVFIHQGIHTYPVSTLHIHVLSAWLGLGGPARRLFPAWTHLSLENQLGFQGVWPLRLFDCCLNTGRPLFDSSLTAVWPLLEHYLTTVWPLFDRCLTTGRPLFDSSLTAVWPLKSIPLKAEINTDNNNNKNINNIIINKK